MPGNPNPVTKWKPGQSGNLTGRPKGDLARKIRERLEGGEDLIDVAFQIANGELTYKISKPDRSGEWIDYTVAPTVTERLAAINAIWTRAYGQPLQHVNVNATQGDGLEEQVAALSDEELARTREYLEKARALLLATQGPSTVVVK